MENDTRGIIQHDQETAIRIRGKMFCRAQNEGHLMTLSTYCKIIYTYLPIDRDSASVVWKFLGSPLNEGLLYARNHLLYISGDDIKYCVELEEDFTV